MALIDNEELNQQDFDSIEDEQPVEAAAPAEVPEEVEVPDKYRGKSINDIVRMHQEAEKLIGKQAQEVGEVRKLADELLKQQLSSRKETPSEVETDIDFFEDPKKAVQRAVDSHPDIVAAKEASKRMKQMEIQQKLTQEHPDFQQILQDSDFAEWIKASPVRRQMYVQADSQYDWDAANELLSTYKQIKAVQNKTTADTSSAARKQNLKAAAVDVGGTGESSKKVYRRADLIRLRMTDPARYEALQPEIMAAYSEGRVK